VPIFDALADPALVARLSAEGEEAGWDGIFLWDHVRWREPVLEVADAWITLAAIATATQTIRLGPMVTPLARRRTGQGRQGDRDPGSAERRPLDARRRPRQRPVRERVPPW
jgi:Luciferase-like monooxygenase